MKELFQSFQQQVGQFVEQQNNFKTNNVSQFMQAAKFQLQTQVWAQFQFCAHQLMDIFSIYVTKCYNNCTNNMHNSNALVPITKQTTMCHINQHICFKKNNLWSILCNGRKTKQQVIRMCDIMFNNTQNLLQRLDGVSQLCSKKVSFKYFCCERSLQEQKLNNNYRSQITKNTKKYIYTTSQLKTKILFYHKILTYRKL
eukprot:TRINITY_DN27063_c0_g2_i2.p1 TRINITY_DN27063_c0_g2~~TRINITY_DN27063_c0_g2_i2.p1  ORF type:complete len:199 (-),score=-9.84 TRINITY_DN27063_c0_g2_i2:375-971(-)